MGLLAVACSVTCVPSRAADVALAGDRAVGQLGVGREVVVDAVDQDRRGDLHLDVELRRGAVARHQAIRQILLKPDVPRRQRALVAVCLAGAGKGHKLIDALAVGRAGQQRDGFVRPQSGHVGRDLDRFAVEGHRIAGADVLDRHAGRRRQGRPGPQYAEGRNQGALRRDGHVQGEHRHRGGQQQAQTQHAAVVHGGLDADLRQIGGRPLLDGLVHDRQHLLAAAAEQQEIDQAVLKRAVALLDGLRGIDRADAAQHGRQDPPPERGPRRGQPTQPKHQPAAEPQAPRDHPMVQQGHYFQESQRAGRDDQPSAGDVDHFDLAAGLQQPIVDERVVAGRRLRSLGAFGGVTVPVAMTIAPSLSCLDCYPSPIIIATIGRRKMPQSRNWRSSDRPDVPASPVPLKRMVEHGRQMALTGCDPPVILLV